MYGFDEITMEKPEKYIRGNSVYAMREKRIEEELKQMRERYQDLEAWTDEYLLTFINMPAGNYLRDYSSDELMDLDEAIDLLLDGNFSIVDVKNGVVHR